jgi:inorganic pyrophosphatase
VIKVLIQAEAGSHERVQYDEKTLTPSGIRRVSRPYPYPYGFVIATTTEDGDNIDCYILNSDQLTPGSIVRCEPIGLLEQWEADQSDHKVLAVMPGGNISIPEKTLEIFQDFIYGVFSEYPEITVTVGPIHSRKAALRYLSMYEDA